MWYKLKQCRHVTVRNYPLKSSETKSPSASTSRRRLWAFRLLTSVLVPALFFVVAEAGLRTLGYGYPTSFLVPAAGRAGYLTDNYKFAWRFFPKALARAPQPIMVLANKPATSKRIVVFGGSAAMGDPEPAYGLPRVLERLLAARFPGQDFEVINAGVTAINSHVVLPIAKDCRRLDADAWVIYVGNNEVHGPFGAGTVFGGNDRPRWLNQIGLVLQRTTLGQLAFRLKSRDGDSGGPKNWGGMEMFRDSQIAHDDPGLDRVYSNFRQNLADVLGTAAKANTAVVLSTVVTNLKDSSPFVSVHSAPLSDAARQQWQAAFDAGCQAQSQGDYVKANAEFEQAAAIDPDYAELEYRRGQCHLQLGDPSKAKREFESARDHDALRFRADFTINRIIREVAQGEDHVSLIDSEAELSGQLEDGIIGDEFLYEHVHLNFNGNYQLGMLLADAIAERLGLQTHESANSAWPSPAECADALGLTPYHELMTLRDIRGRLNAPPFTGQSNHAERDKRLIAQGKTLSDGITPDAAIGLSHRYRALIQDRPRDWLLRQQFALLLDSMGDLAGATEQFQEITKQLPHHAESHFRLGSLMNRTKTWGDAEKALRRALMLRPDFARAANSLGICLSHQKRHNESCEQFQRAVEIQPTFAEAFDNWGLVLADQGEKQAALAKYRQAVKADADYLPAQIRLGRVYLAAEDYASALPHYQAVANKKPKDPIAHLNLGLLYREVGDAQSAKSHLQKTLELDPNNRVARQNLNQLESISP